MLCMLREKLMAQALKLATVSAVYRTESQRFVDAYLGWLEDAEKDLSPLRSPICILLQGEKSSLTSVPDGYLPDYLQLGKSIRKSRNAVAAQSLAKISSELHDKIESLDESLEQLNEKFCHAVAVLGSKEPELYHILQADQSGVTRIWNLLGSTTETIPMYNYFCAKLASADIHYLLLDIIQKIRSNTTDQEQ